MADEDPKIAVLRALVEQCERAGMRDDPVVMRARAALPKEEPKPEPTNG